LGGGNKEDLKFKTSYIARPCYETHTKKGGGKEGKESKQAARMESNFFFLIFFTGMALAYSSDKGKAQRKRRIKDSKTAKHPMNPEKISGAVAHSQVGVQQHHGTSAGPPNIFLFFHSPISHKNFYSQLLLKTRKISHC
jgi:hypothetical protein